MITFLDGQFSAFNAYIKNAGISKVFILADENTHQYCLPTFLGNMETTIPFEIIEIEAGEALKNIETATQLWEILTDFKADRNALLINVGGGVISDLGGFVASTYKRGIRFVNMPTTLLAMCDAAIGGKTGIDHGYLKNIVGIFANAERIFVYPPFLETLPFTELRSGFAEMLKHGLIADENHWQQLGLLPEINVADIIPHIETSMKIKQSIVEQDFQEKNIRKTLNFGHTVGHAYESLFLAQGQPVPHGESVALGMIIETRISQLEGLIDEETAHEIIQILRKFYPLLDIGRFDTGELLGLMNNDKKNTSGAISFSLISGIGKGIYDQKVQTKNLLDAIEYYTSLC